MTNIVIVKKNADFTEGSGPMVFDAAFSSLENAKKYVNSKKTGIYGAKPNNGMTLADWCMATRTETRPDGTTYESNIDGGWSGYEIIQIELDEKLLTN